jgi:hypothetical protein
MKAASQARRATSLAKLCVIRHGGGSRRSCNAEEKAIETVVRQAGKAECRESTKVSAGKRPSKCPGCGTKTPMDLNINDDTDKPEWYCGECNFTLRGTP